MAKLTKEEKEKRKLERREKKFQETHKLIDEVDHKICNICEEWIPANEEYFYINDKNMVDGLHPYCKKCASKKSVKWGQRNIERKRISNNKWSNNPENKHFVRNNRSNAIKRGTRKKWEASNKNKLYDYRLKRKTTHKHLISNLEWELCREYFSYSCAYCGISEKASKEKYKQILHKEHVKHDGANDLSNCVPACKMCNSNKWTYELNEWYNQENEIFSSTRYEKIIVWLETEYKQFIK